MPRSLRTCCPTTRSPTPTPSRTSRSSRRTSTRLVANGPSAPSRAEGPFRALRDVGTDEGTAVGDRGFGGFAISTTEERRVTDVVDGDRPRRADGIQLMGEYAGSGFKEPPGIVRRSDGQVIQLTRLLFLVAEAADGSRRMDEIAEEVSRSYEKQVSAENVRTLVEKLRPMGVLADAAGRTPDLERPDQLLALRFRKGFVSERAVAVLARVFRPLFLPPVVVAVLAGSAAVDVWVFGTHGFGEGLRDALYQPGYILLVLAFVVVSAAFHEIGHAAACAYGGAKPGRIGAGLYLCWPAFFTDVTDSYRLDRRGRLRTDLGGVYFNLVFVLATAGLYAITGFEPLLLVIIFQHFEIAHQLLPVVRLDGYYIVSDLVGVPDLFTRMRSILQSALPWQRSDDRV